MRDEPIRASTGQFDRPAVHTAEQDGRRVVGEWTRVEERLKSVERVRLRANVQRGSVGEGLPDRAHDRDVVLHASQGVGPRHAESPLDVLANLGGEPQIETSAPRGRGVPGLKGRQHRAARECQGEAGLHAQAICCHQRQQGDHHRVVNRLGHVEDVEAHRLDPLRVRPHLGQRHAVAHAGDQQHRRAPSGEGERWKSGMFRFLPTR